LFFWLVLSAGAVEGFYTQAGSRLGKLLAAGVFIFLVFNSLSQNFLYYAYQNGNRPDWKGAFSLVESQKNEGDRIATNVPEVGEYYLDEKPDYINDLESDEIESQETRVWFVFDEGNGWVKPDLFQWIKTNSTLVEVFPVNLPGKNLDVRVYRYEPTH
jgi:hypothetical protein